MERSSLRFDEAKGPKLLPRFVVYVALAAGLMVADYRFSLMQPVRAAVMPMLYPAQWLANQPVQLYQYFADLSQSKSELLEQNRRLLEENGRLKIDLQRNKVNTDELRELKKLYGLQQKRHPQRYWRGSHFQWQRSAFRKTDYRQRQSRRLESWRCGHRSKRFDRPVDTSPYTKRGNRADLKQTKHCPRSRQPHR